MCFQNEVLLDIDIQRPTLFRIVFHFVNRNRPTVNGQVTLTSENPSIQEQSAIVYFPATNGRTAFATANTPVYLTTGRSVHVWQLLVRLHDRYMATIKRRCSLLCDRYTVSLKSPQTLFVVV